MEITKAGVLKIKKTAGALEINTKAGTSGINVVKNIMVRRKQILRVAIALMLCFVFILDTPVVFAGVSAESPADEQAKGLKAEQAANTARSANGLTAVSSADRASDPASASATDSASGPATGLTSDPASDLAADPSDEPDPWTPQDGLPRLKKLKLNFIEADQLRVSWQTSADFDGYVINYATNFLYISKKTVRIKDGTATNALLDNLNKKKKYYVRIRGYKNYEGDPYYTDWVNKKTSSGSSIASIKFVTSGGSKVDIRKQAGSKLKYYDIAQGTCNDGVYLYMAFENRRGDDNGNGRARIKIAKVRISNWKLVKVSPSGQKLGHANDIAYNPRKKILVVTGAKTNDPYVRIVSPKTLKKKARKKVVLKKGYKHIKAFNAIDYDPKSRTYYIRSRNYDGWSFTLDENFKMKSGAIVPSVYPTRHIQSCTSSGDTFLISQSYYQSSSKNSVTIFSKAGEKLQHIKIKMKGELESLFFIGGKLYATMHKKMKGYKTGFIFQIRL